MTNVHEIHAKNKFIWTSEIKTKRRPKRPKELIFKTNITTFPYILVRHICPENSTKYIGLYLFNIFLKLNICF